MVKRKRDAVANTSRTEIRSAAASSLSAPVAAGNGTRRTSVRAQAKSVATVSSVATSQARRTPRRLSTMNVTYADRPSDDDEALDVGRSGGDKAQDGGYSSTGSPLSSAPASDAEAEVEAVVITKKKKIMKTEAVVVDEAAPKIVKVQSGTKKKTPKSALLSPDDDVAAALTRPPAVNSDYVPIPWKGRLGYACLNTYLRACNPPIFCSRTCRIETIKKNEDEAPGGGLKYLQSLGLANATDLSKMIEWNERYGIRFLRISSEMFPFASHETYGYDLEFAKEPLRKAGKLAMKYGHRLSMHPGQFTQIGSPRKEVVIAAVRELRVHCDLLDSLGLTGQADRDAVMIIHMGGVYMDKPVTVERFKKNYRELLDDGIRRRLVLENDDVSYCVEDVLPVCLDLGVPLVLDWHHHNILPGTMREGTLEVLEKYGDAIAKTWTDKGITQKQHMSEPRPEAVTNRDRIKHSKRIHTFPPCADTMDLMLEAKDKEQAVFELMKIYSLPGIERINDVIPHERQDQNVEVKPVKKSKKKKKASAEEEEEEEEKAVVVPLIPEKEVAMGGSERRVYYPEGNEDWLMPKKKERKKKEEVIEETAEPKAIVTASPAKKVRGRAKATA